jgi:hypothetical protein
MELSRIFSNNPKHDLLYLLNFLVAFHFFLLIYINSSFLTTFVSERTVGTIFIVDFLYIFFVLAAILLAGTYFSLSMHDTRQS